MPSSFSPTAPIQLYALMTVLGVAVLEAYWSAIHHQDLYNCQDTAANLCILAGFRLSSILFFHWQFFCLNWSSQWAIFPFRHSLPVFLLTFVVVDFLYYWEHRAMHEVSLLWIFHEVHHSSPWLNLTTAFRLNWFLGSFAFLFFLPAALLGLPIRDIGASLALNLLFQYFLHTQVIGSLRTLEGVINTPSAHRVHHACNRQYIDRNYGGVLMVWDRLFGSYQAESEPPVYGVTSGFHGHNPLRLVIQGGLDYFRGNTNSRG